MLDGEVVDVYKKRMFNIIIYDLVVLPVVVIIVLVISIVVGRRCTR